MTQSGNIKLIRNAGSYNSHLDTGVVQLLSRYHHQNSNPPPSEFEPATSQFLRLQLRSHMLIHTLTVIVNTLTVNSLDANSLILNRISRIFVVRQLTGNTLQVWAYALQFSCPMKGEQCLGPCSLAEVKSWVKESNLPTQKFTISKIVF